MSLIVDYSSSSSSDTESNDSDIEEEPIKQTETDSVKLLPSAISVLAPGAQKSNQVGQALSNPFREAEQAKTAVLEKHVKMVNKNEHLKEKNGKKICWNYRKGRCRFGSSCNYAHDSDLNFPAMSEDLKNKKDVTRNVMLTKTAQSTTPQQQMHDIDSTAAETTKKRKRPGLTDAIEPSKRVIKNYIQQQAKKS